jgi:glutamate dehydrogenase/leucine dehydrogenase
LGWSLLLAMTLGKNFCHPYNFCMPNSRPPLEIFELHDKELDFDAYICVDSLRRGLAFGGCRFDLSVTKDVVVQLAQCMTWKLAAHGLPVGGSKAGLRVNPKNPRIGEILKKFAQAAKHLLAEKVLIGKDLGASNEMIDAVYESISIPQLHLLKRRPGSESVPNRIRDFSGYQSHMTALGVAWAADTALRPNTLGKTAVIQGFGAVGLGAAVRLSNIGVRVVGVSDARIGVFNANGFPTDVLIAAGNRGVLDGTAQGLPYFHEVLESDDILTREVDIVVLAAASNSVSAELAKKISAPLVVEGSNFGLVPEARRILFERGIVVIPDVLANSTSAALVAHQMATLNKLSHERLWRKIEAAVIKNVRESMEVARTERIDIRNAYTEILVPRILNSIAD